MLVVELGCQLERDVLTSNGGVTKLLPCARWVEAGSRPEGGVRFWVSYLGSLRGDAAFHELKSL